MEIYVFIISRSFINGYEKGNYLLSNIYNITRSNFQKTYRREHEEGYDPRKFWCNMITLYNSIENVVIKFIFYYGDQSGKQLKNYIENKRKENLKTYFGLMVLIDNYVEDYPNKNNIIYIMKNMPLKYEGEIVHVNRTIRYGHEFLYHLRNHLPNLILHSSVVINNVKKDQLIPLEKLKFLLGINDKSIYITYNPLKNSKDVKNYLESYFKSISDTEMKNYLFSALDVDQ